jgi:hypothetical protein
MHNEDTISASVTTALARAVYITYCGAQIRFEFG